MARMDSNPLRFESTPMAIFFLRFRRTIYAKTVPQGGCSEKVFQKDFHWAELCTLFYTLENSASRL